MPIFIKPRKRLNRMVKYLEDRPREKILGVAYFVVGENGCKKHRKNEASNKIYLYLKCQPNRYSSYSV